MLNSTPVQTVGPTSKQSGASSLTAKIAWALLIVATLYVCYFSHLGAIGFAGPDEPRYAWIARDMAETGDWVTPRLYGHPWFEKPVLYYWGAALSFKVFGVSEAAARLPSAISALLATLALAWLARRLYGAETARQLLLLLPTTVGMIGFSHAAATDMPFSGLLTVAMVAAAVVLRLAEEPSMTSRMAGAEPAGSAASEERRSSIRWTAPMLFGFFLGAAVLAKGPAGIILAGGAVFFWALFTKRWRDAFRLLHPAGILVFCLTALPWYVLCAHRNPGFLRVFIVEHNFKRYLTPEFQHIQPFWYYTPVVLLAFLPWTAALLWSAFAGSLRRWRTPQPWSAQVVFLLSWAGFCLAFFTLSKSKLPGYVLPAIPPVAFLLARSCTALAEQYRKSFAFTLFAFAIALAGAVAFIDQLHSPQHLPRLTTNIAGVLMLLLALSNSVMSCAFFRAAKTTAHNALVALSIAPVLFALLFLSRLLPHVVSDQFSARTLAGEIRNRNIPRDEIAVDGGINRSTRYALNFYLYRELKDWNEQPAAESYVISGGRRCQDFHLRDFTCTDMDLAVPGTGVSVSHLTPTASAPRLPGSRELN